MEKVSRQKYEKIKALYKKTKKSRKKSTKVSEKQKENRQRFKENMGIAKSQWNNLSAEKRKSQYDNKFRNLFKKVMKEYKPIEFGNFA